MRLIDADKLTAERGDWYVEEGPEEGFIGTLKQLMDETETVDAVQVRHGRWIPHITEDGIQSGYDCSECGQWFFMGPTNHLYCCDCGAKMENVEASQSVSLQTPVTWEP